MWGLMENEKAVLQVAAESLIHVISHSMDARKRNSIAAEVGNVLSLSVAQPSDVEGIAAPEGSATGQWPHVGYVPDA